MRGPVYNCLFYGGGKVPSVNHPSFSGIFEFLLPSWVIKFTSPSDHHLLKTRFTLKKTSYESGNGGTVLVIRPVQGHVMARG